MTHRHITFKTALLSACAGLALQAGAQAQEVEEAEEAEEAVDGEPGMERMIVTARRREESALDVPISLSSFSGEELLRQGAQDITHLSQTTPNLTLEVSRGTNNTVTAFIRGFGQQDPVAGFEQGVGIYVDDVYLNRPQAAVLEILNVDRIEVLRGPQGTLYGRNTIGGAVKYVTQGLSDAPSFDLRVAAGSFRQTDVTLNFSLPVVDGLKIGGSFGRFFRNGFGENLELEGIENYQKDIVAGRVKLEFDPIDKLSIHVSGDWLIDDSDPRQGFRLTEGLLTGAPILDDVFNTRAGLDIPEQRVQARGVAANAEYRVTDNLSVKAIVSYRDDISESPIDFDSLPSGDLDVPVIYGNDQYSAELQATYESDLVAGVAGFYYLDAAAFNVFDVLLANTGDLIGLPGLNAQTLGDVDTSTWSIFGDATFDLTEAFDIDVAFVKALNVSFGGRYTNDRRDARILRTTFIGGFSDSFGGVGIPIATTSDFNEEDTFRDFSPRASIDYKPAENLNLYFSYSQGFKGGGFDPRAQTTAVPDLDGDGAVSEDEIFDFVRFRPEEVDSYEIGAKTSFFGGRLNANVAAFWAQYRDVQIPGSIGVDVDGDGVFETFAGVTTNAGRARSRGLELEGDAVIVEDALLSGDALDATVAIGLIDAEFREFILNGENVASERDVQNTPDVTFNAMMAYGLPLEIYGVPGRLSFFNAVSYRSFTQQFEFSSPIDQEGYLLYDAGVSWASESGRWLVQFNARNITDKEYRVAGYDFFARDADGNINLAAPTLGLEGTLTAFYGNPRTFTGTLGVRF